MGIMDLFSTPFIFSLLIIIVLLGVLYAYFNYKLSEQDHKITSMFGLVKSMAQEIQYIREVQTGSFIEKEPINLEYATQLIHNNDDVEVNKDELITVSTDGDTNEDISDSDNSDSDSEYSDDVEIDDDLGDDFEIEELNFDNNDTTISNDVKTIHLEDSIHFFQPIDLNFTSVPEVEAEAEAEAEASVDDLVDPEKINIDILDNVNESVFVNTNDDIININSNSNSKTDFKKLPLNKLREIIVEKGLIMDATKLKKNEILKMLGEE